MTEKALPEKEAPTLQHQLAALRKGLRSCLACRTAFPNRLALVKHEIAGCRKMKK